MDRSLSVVIITLNEAENIKACIKSVADLADEIIVGDSGSSDQTKTIASEAGAKVIDIEWEGYGPTKNKLSTLAKYNWILSLDADEQLSDELRSELQMIKNQSLRGAYSFPRKNFYGKKWLKYGGWYPDRKIRLYDKRIIRWNQNPVHEELVLPSGQEAIPLKGALLHFTIKNRDHHRKIIKKYALLRAERLLQQGRSQSLPEGALRAIVMFVKRYILKLGFLDGRPGLLAAIESARARWLTYGYLKGGREDGRRLGS